MLGTVVNLSQVAEGNKLAGYRREARLRESGLPRWPQTSLGADARTLACGQG